MMSRGRDEEPRPYKAAAPRPAAPSTKPSSHRDLVPAASTPQINCPSLAQPLQAERGGGAARGASELHGKHFRHREQQEVSSLLQSCSWNHRQGWKKKAFSSLKLSWNRMIIRSFNPNHSMIL